MGSVISRRELLWLAVIAEGGLAVIAGLLGWGLTVPPWEQTRLSLADAGLGVAGCVPMLALFIIPMRWPLGPWRHMHALVDEVIRPIFRRATVLDLALICLLAGVGEEWLCRGFIQAGLIPYIGTWWALAIASLFFGLLHPLSAFYVIFAAVVGVYLGVLMLATDNLLVPTIAHGVYDFAALIYLRSTSEPRRSGSGHAVA
jgi:uncharacterized protein